MRALRMRRPCVTVVEVAPPGSFASVSTATGVPDAKPDALQVDSELLPGWIDVEAQPAGQPAHHPVLLAGLLELELGQLAAEIHVDDVAGLRRGC